MDVGIADPAPVTKLDPELEGRLGTRHEFALIDPEPLIETANVRDGGFADADRADLERLDDADASAPMGRPQQLIVQYLARLGNVVEQVFSLYSNLDLRGHVVKEGATQGPGILVHDRGVWHDHVPCRQQESRTPAPRQAGVPGPLVVEQGS